MVHNFFLMMSSVTRSGSHFFCLFLFLTFKNLLLWNGWKYRGKNFTQMNAYPWETKVIPMTSWVTWFGSHIGFTRKPIKIHHFKEVLARVCNLWLLFFLFTKRGWGKVMWHNKRFNTSKAMCTAGESKDWWGAAKERQLFTKQRHRTKLFQS